MKKILRLIKAHQVLSEVAVAFLLTVTVLYMMGKTFSREYFLVGLLMIAIYGVIHYGVRAYNLRRLKFALWYAAPFAVAFWLGQKVIYQSIEIREITFLDLPLIVALMVIFTMMTMALLAFIDKKCFIPKKKEEDLSGRKKWLVYAAIIFACYVPLFLAFFPGIVSVDSAVQIRQAIGEGEMSNWHPVLHTLFVAGPVNIGRAIFGDLTAGIALSTLVQMVILALIFGYTARWLFDKTQKNWVARVAVAFFALCPVVAFYAVTMWKDVLFSACFMLLVMKIYDLLTMEEREEKISWRKLGGILLLAILVVFLRNGGALIVVALGMALLVYYKKSRKVISLGFLGVIIFMMVMQGPVYRALNISSSPFMESMSVPAQQIGHLVYTDRLASEEKEALGKFADVERLATNYTPMNADPAKNSFNYGAVEDDKAGFLKLWAELLTRHFGGYVKAYILQIYSYWYVQGDVWAIDFEHEHDAVWLEAEYTDQSLIGEGLQTMIQKVEQGLSESSWFGWINNVGILFWGMGLMLIIFLYQRQYYMLVLMAPIFMYMISLLIASPISWMFRYVYSLLLMMPILITASFIKRKGEKI